MHTYIGNGKVCCISGPRSVHNAPDFVKRERTARSIVFYPYQIIYKRQILANSLNIVYLHILVKVRLMKLIPPLRALP